MASAKHLGGIRSFIVITSFNPRDNPVTIPIQTQEDRPREIERHPQSHPDGECCSPAANGGVRDRKPGPFFTGQPARACPLSLYSVEVSPIAESFLLSVRVPARSLWGGRTTRVGLGQWGHQEASPCLSSPPTFFLGVASSARALLALTVSVSVITRYQHQVPLGPRAYWNPPEAHLSSIPHQRGPSSPETSPFPSASDRINLPKDPVQPLGTNHNRFHIEFPWALFYFFLQILRRLH